MKKNLLSCLAMAFMLFAGTLQGYALEKNGDGVYQITSSEDMFDFAELVNGGETLACAVLTNDIDMNEKDFNPIGSVENPYRGTFDGQGHKVLNLYVDANCNQDADGNYSGLFGVLAGGAHIMNVAVTGDVSANKYAAGIAGGTNGSGIVTFENCGNEAEITVEDINAGGILGVNQYSAATIHIINCYNTGAVSGPKECAAISGWVGNNAIVSNCWNTGEIWGVESSKPFCRFQSCTFENCWDVQAIQDGIGVISEEDLAGLESGDFCYRMLNQTKTEDAVWRQDLGTDEHPYPFASHGIVYAVGDLNCDGTSKSGSTSYSNSNTSNRDPHNFADGECTKCHEWDPDYLTADEESFFTLSSDADLYWFVRLVNQKGNNDYSARLANDIEYTHAMRMGVDQRFMGTFDGQFHTVTFNIIDKNEDKAAFIKDTEDATLKNLLLKGEIITEKHFAASIVSETYGATLIQNVVADVNISSTYSGDATNGGLVAVGHGTTQLENCAYVGTLICPNGHGTGGIMGWAGDGQKIGIKNCYVGSFLEIEEGSDNVVICRNNPFIENCWVNEENEDIFKDNEYTTYFDGDKLATGEFCYKNLNNSATENIIWYQTLGEDAWPVPFSTHGTVYVAGEQYCDGTPKGDGMGYSNDPSGNRDPHEFDENGFCSNCHAPNPNFLNPGDDNFYALSNATELKWFMAYTKSADTKALNAKLVTDIDYEGTDMFGEARCNYGGVFDGQEHTIKMSMDREEESRAALFNYVEDAVIKNLIIDGEIKTNGQFAAGVAVESFGKTVIKNVLVKADIYSEIGVDTENESGVEDGTHGGIMAIANDYLTVENCAFVGTLTAETAIGCAGIVAWAQGGSNVTIKNCYVAGEIDLPMGHNNTDIARNNPYVDNCWASYDLSFYNNNTNNQYFDVDDEMLSGELCYKLKGDWHQDLGQDNYPVPFASHQKVYAHGDVTCDGDTSDLTYDNVEGQPNYIAHNFVDGECDGCHNAYLIDNAEDLADFSWDIFDGLKSPDASVELGADIDLAEAIFIPIGALEEDGGHPYCGTFDGKGHKISHMIIDDKDLRNQGFFGCVTSGAVIKNLVIDETCSINAKERSAGLIGATTGYGTLLIENCGNDATVTVLYANGAGILGVDDYAGLIVTMTNCYNTGVIKGGWESAGISGWLNKRSVVTNSWNNGEVMGLDGTNTFSRSQDKGAQYINCYETIGSQVTPVTDQQVENGELTAMLNKGAGYDAWYQEVGVDAHPMLTFKDTSSSIESVATVVANGKTAIYNINGMKMNELQKGLNIVRMGDGTVKKVIVK